MRCRPVGVFLFVTACLFMAASWPAELWAQNMNAPARLEEGLSHFRNRRYREAVASFENIIADTQESFPEAEGRPEAYYWTARSYLALNRLDDAERALEYFLGSYPAHPLYPDALYHKGRLLFLQDEPENAILALGDFVARYPAHELVANALFWVGESLYSLGQLDDAARVFEKVRQEYPASFRVSEADYRLSLIEFKKRENELLRLLKWSHEETLRVTEEFERREKAYEQAISVYQRRLSAAGTPAPRAEAGEEADLAALYQDLENRRKLLEAKEEALAVKEALLEAMSRQLNLQ